MKNVSFIKKKNLMLSKLANNPFKEAGEEFRDVVAVVDTE